MHLLTVSGVVVVLLAGVGDADDHASNHTDNREDDNNPVEHSFGVARRPGPVNRMLCTHWRANCHVHINSFPAPTARGGSSTACSLTCSLHPSNVVLEMVWADAFLAVMFGAHDKCPNATNMALVFAFSLSSVRFRPALGANWFSNPSPRHRDHRASTTSPNWLTTGFARFQEPAEIILGVFHADPSLARSFVAVHSCENPVIMARCLVQPGMSDDAVFVLLVMHRRFGYDVL